MRDTKIKEDNILIVDGTNLIFRNYFAHTYRRSQSGIHIGGLYGSIRSLNSYVNAFNPKQVFICFDKGRKSFRDEIYPNYKKTRKKTDEDLSLQIPMFKKYCELANMPFIELENYEADDLIGSLACNAKNYDLNPYAVTGDKDILQLLNRGIDILYLSNNGPIIYGKGEFVREFKINPEQYLDYKALVGDPSDNIPGVPGVGKKTAAKLLNLYESLDGIYRNIGRLRGKQKENLVENKEKVYIFKEILTMKCHMDLDYDKYFKCYIEEGFDLNSHGALEYLKDYSIEL